MSERKIVLSIRWIEIDRILRRSRSSSRRSLSCPTFCSRLRSARRAIFSYIRASSTRRLTRMKLRDVFLREATYRVRSTRGICWKGERGRIKKKREKKKKKRRRKGRLPRPYNDRGRSEEKRGRRKSRYLKLHGSFYYLSPAISASTRSHIFWPGDRSMICAAASRIRRRSIGRHRSPASLLAISALLSARAEKMEKVLASPSLYSTLLSQEKKRRLHAVSPTYFLT